jgi:O-antigen/teichoic acid export membrane protein
VSASDPDAPTTPTTRTPAIADDTAPRVSADGSTSSHGPTPAQPDAGRNHSYGSGARILSVGIAATGLLTFAYFSIASHVLSGEAAQRVDVLWSVMFVVISVIYRPVEQLLSRTIAERRAHGHDEHPLRVPIAIQAGFALAFLVVALALHDELIDHVFGGYAALYDVLVVGTLAYAGSYFARGWLAGHQYFGLFGALVLMESTSRICFALAVALGLASGQTAVALGIAVAPLLSLVVVPVAFARRGSERGGARGAPWFTAAETDEHTSASARPPIDEHSTAYANPPTDQHSTAYANPPTDQHSTAYANPPTDQHSTAYTDPPTPPSGGDPAGAAPITVDEADAALAGPGTEGVQEVAAHEELSLSRGGRFALWVSGIMLSEQALLNAAVLTVDALSPNKALAGIVFNVMLIARAPLQLFQAIQTSLLPHLTGLEAKEGHTAFARAIRLTVLAIATFAAAVALGLLAVGPFVMSHILFGQTYTYNRFGLALVGLGMGMHLASGTLNQAALARNRARAAATCWLVAAIAFLAWMLTPLVGEQVLRAEVGYCGATTLLAVLLGVLYRRGTPG